jgi:hypothetical protein
MDIILPMEIVHHVMDFYWMQSQRYVAKRKQSIHQELLHMVELTTDARRDDVTWVFGDSATTWLYRNEQSKKWKREITFLIRDNDNGRVYLVMEHFTDKTPHVDLDADLNLWTCDITSSAFCSDENFIYC